MSSALHSRTPLGRARLIGVASPDQHRRLLSSTIAAVLALLAALLGLALAFAPRADAYVYWTAPGTPSGPTIGRANLDGTGMSQSFISGVGPPLAIAVDAGHIYWENHDTNTIGRANLDGTGVNKNFIGEYTVRASRSTPTTSTGQRAARSAAPTSTAPTWTRTSSAASSR